MSQKHGNEIGKSSRRAFLKMAGGAFALGAVAPNLAFSQTPPPEKKNVLFLSLDDLNLALGCYGNKDVKTPNIDRLAERGVRFTRAFAQWPSCLPSRMSFLSGWYPPRTEVRDFSARPRTGALKDAVYMPQHFKNEGYTTVRLDKIFHIGADDPASWTITEEPYWNAAGQFQAVWTGIELKKLGIEDKIIEQGKYKVPGEGGTYYIMDCEEEELFDGRTTKRAVELIGQFAESKEPFFLGVGLRRPHLPWVAPKKYFDMYPPDSITLPPREGPDGQEAPYDEKTHREMIAHYYAAVTFADAQVGKIIEALDASGLADNTTIVLFGDQGYKLGEGGSRFGKGLLDDGSLQVPLIIAEPGMKTAGRSCDAMTGLVDMYPTLASMCSLAQPPVPLDGRDLSPLLENPDGKFRDYIMSFKADKEAASGYLRSIRTARFRYNEDSKGRPLELFDCEADPHNLDNLVENPDYLSIVRDLSAKIEQQLSGL